MVYSIRTEFAPPGSKFFPDRADSFPEGKAHGKLQQLCFLADEAEKVTKCVKPP